MNVIELASADGSPTAEISGTQSCSRSVAMTRVAASKTSNCEPVSPERTRSAICKPAETERLPVRAGPQVGAFAGPLDEAVLVAVVPSVQDELVQTPHAILDEVPHRLVARQDRDELVRVAERRLEQTEASRREGHLGRAVARGGPVDARRGIVEARLEASEDALRAVAVPGRAGREVRDEETANGRRVRVEARPVVGGRRTREVPARERVPVGGRELVVEDAGEGDDELVEALPERQPRRRPERRRAAMGMPAVSGVVLL